MKERERIIKEKKRRNHKLEFKLDGLGDNEDEVDGVEVFDVRDGDRATGNGILSPNLSRPCWDCSAPCEAM